MNSELPAATYLRRLRQCLSVLPDDERRDVLDEIESHFVSEPGMHEVLGWWTIPVFLGLAVVLLWSSTRALRALARWRLSRSAPRLHPSRSPFPGSPS